MAGHISVKASGTDTYNVLPGEITNGYIVKKVWLDHYGVPTVTVTGASYTNVPALPAGVKPGSTADVVVRIGKDHKRPFALVYVPAYNSISGSNARLTGFTLGIAESAAAPAEAAKPTAGTNSVLAAGTWYKISVADRGLYKIDYDFIKNKLGVDPAGINPANIRVYGNGGVMLSEDNSVTRPSDLTENAVWVNDGGDGNFSQGDYLVFYANGPMGWNADLSKKIFTHQKNLYEDKSYYFINFDQGAGKRVAAVSGTQAGNVTVNRFNDYAVHDNDLVNIAKIGKEWWGEQFASLSGQSTSATVNMNTGGISDSLRIRFYAAAYSSGSSNLFNIALNGQTLDVVNIGATPTLSLTYVSAYREYNIPFTGSSANFNITFQPSSQDAKGYLNYIELNYRKQLAMSGGQMTFRDLNSVGSGNTAQYQLGNANSSTQIWDITDPLVPVKINGTLSGGTFSFSRDAATLHEFAAFDGSQYNAPAFVGKVDNQNLHGMAQADYIIITNPAFLDAANKLADFHRQHDNMRVAIATTQQVYNEFSSGSQDASAIRDFLRMFYDRAGTDTTEMPRYALLLGDASYDPKDRVNSNSNFVPVFESAESASIDGSFSGDDFFAFLDDNENIESYNVVNTLDVGLGRFPVQKASEANALVDKIIHYKSPATLGPWRLNNTYVGDNEDNAGPHLQDADDMSMTVDEEQPIYNDTKVYLDNMNFVSTPGGDRCPDANKAINDQIFKGTFFVNYSGHGSIYTLAHERILTSDDFNSWKNADKLPFFVTATCDFSRFDDPEYQSAGEKMILKTDGGAIAMLTTTQAVYAGPTLNHAMNQSFLQAQFAESHGQWNTFGDAFRTGKNATYSFSHDPFTLINFRKFTLLGDPALEPAFPKYAVHTDTIKSLDGGIVTDSVKALGGYTITGHVTDADGNSINDFNGRLYVTVYDKPRTVTVQTKVFNQTRSWNEQNNIVYRGKATVTNGRFSFSFITPKDINYDFGKGKISYYVENGTTDGAGIDSSVVIGGFTDNPPVDNNGPVVKPYMNDSLFRDGGITGTNSVLFVSIYDESGINVSGNSVGHDLTAVLDDNIAQPYTLNDYYETAPNDYKRGYVTFPVTGLPDGEHYFTVKAWDVYNNSGEGTVHFVVVNGNVVKVDNLMNYPNPFSDITHFVFEHNHPNETLKAQLRIYNLAGSLVRSIDRDFAPEGSRSHEITWDGTDNNGAKLPSAMYVYRLTLSTSAGIQSTAYQKVILQR